MQSDSPAIAMFGLTKAFGPRRAVDNITLTVAPGTVFGFLGRTAPARPPPSACCSA